MFWNHFLNYLKETKNGNHRQWIMRLFKMDHWDLQSEVRTQRKDLLGFLSKDWWINVYLWILSWISWLLFLFQSSFTSTFKSVAGDTRRWKARPRLCHPRCNRRHTIPFSSALVPGVLCQGHLHRTGRLLKRLVHWGPC